MGISKTPSFIVEVPLRVTEKDGKQARSRLEAARQVRNACLGEALKRLKAMRGSVEYQTAKALPKGKGRIDTFKAVRKQYGFSEASLHSYAKQFGKSWIGHHLDSQAIQAQASIAFKSANRYALGKGGRPRFKSKGQLDSVEGKSNVTGIMWKADHIEWKGLVLAGVIDPKDEVLAYGLSCRVKYVRLVRRKLNKTERYFA